MLHAINAWLARQARAIRDTGLDRDRTSAARHGWQARQIRPGTWHYRDPRFPRLPMPAATAITTCEATTGQRAS